MEGASREERERHSEAFVNIVNRQKQNKGAAGRMTKMRKNSNSSFGEAELDMGHDKEDEAPLPRDVLERALGSETREETGELATSLRQGRLSSDPVSRLSAIPSVGRNDTLL